MYRITLIMLLSLLLPDIYIYLAYIVRKTPRILLRALWWLPSAVLSGIFFYFLTLSGDNILAHHTHGIGLLAVTIMLFAAPKLIFMLCSIIGIALRGVGRCLSWAIYRTPFLHPCKAFAFHRRPFSIAGALLAVIAFVNILYGAVWGVSRFEVKEVEFVSDRIPQAFDGYRVLQLSDIHIGSWARQPEKISRLVELVNAQKADVIVFTGDLVNQQSRELTAFTSILSGLKATDGVFSVLGNHDYGIYYHWKNAEEEQRNLQQLIEMQGKMGWKLLNNEHVLLTQGRDTIALVGVENDGEPPFSQHANLPQAVAGTEPYFSILLSHNPTHWRREVLPDTHIDLMLAGHTHAMQMELFGRSLSSLIYPEWSGMYLENEISSQKGLSVKKGLSSEKQSFSEKSEKQENQAVNRLLNPKGLYVNVGIGYVGLPFRFGAWPEVTVITLRHPSAH